VLESNDGVETLIPTKREGNFSTITFKDFFCIEESLNRDIGLAIYHVINKDKDILIALHNCYCFFMLLLNALNAFDCEVSIAGRALREVKVKSFYIEDGEKDYFTNNFSKCFILKRREHFGNDYDHTQKLMIDIKFNYTRLPRAKCYRNQQYPLKSYSKITPEFREFKSYLAELYDNKLFTDFTIKCSDGVELKVHRVFLSQRSEYFSKLFTTEMLEKDKNFVEFSDIDSETMEQVLNFIYKSNFTAETQTQTVNLIYAAEKFQMINLKAESIEKLLMQLDLLNVIENFFVAEIHNIDELSHICINMIMANYKEIKGTEEWKNLTKEQYEKIITAFVKFNDTFPHTVNSIKLY
jgi:hypothetical protein